MLSLVSYYTCKSFKQKSSKGKKVDKKMANNLDHKSIRFPKAKKDYSKIQKKNNISINVFGYKNDLVYPVHISKQKFEDFMDSLLINDENKSHYVYIKNFYRFMFNKTKHENQKPFCRYCLQCFSSEKVLENTERYVQK